ncbi:MAG: ethanolamine ammonia-lyase subunit EutC [Candidatus Binataceae bacterium]
MARKDRGRKTSGDDFAAMRRATPARLGVGRAGPRYTTSAMLALRADHARAVDAVRMEVPRDWPARNAIPELRTRAFDREVYLLQPELGRMLADSDAERLAQRYARRVRVPLAQRAKPSLVILIGDGLSSTAVQAHAVAIVRALKRKLAARFRVAGTFFIRNARVRVEDHVGEILHPDIVCMIIGERPGLATAESLSAYVIWRPRLASLEPDRTVISNIHPGGLSIGAAVGKLSRLCADAAAHQATGATLAARLAQSRRTN